MKGYCDPKYAGSFADHGNIRYLPNCRGYVIERRINKTTLLDISGCYPIFCCKKWDKLSDDINTLENDELICMYLVTDVFGRYDMDLLKSTFNTTIIPFKDHYLIDLEKPMEKFIKKHHRDRAKKALTKAHVERVLDPLNDLDEWWDLYKCLIKRHVISGLRSFNKKGLMKQLEINGIHVFKANVGEETIGINIWYQMEDHAYTHLSAYNDIGYKLSVSYALRWFAIDYFQNSGLSCLDIGGGAGLKNDDHGLIQFKEGWSTHKRPVFFCGHIFNQESYILLCKDIKEKNNIFFPLYRLREFI